MKVVWTVQAMHVIDGDNNAVPPAETLIQKLQVLSHDIITSDLDFYKEIAQVGGDVWQDSFKQSQFRLVCGSKGFTIDNESGLCGENDFQRVFKSPTCTLQCSVLPEPSKKTVPAIPVLKTTFKTTRVRQAASLAQNTLFHRRGRQLLAPALVC